MYYMELMALRFKPPCTRSRFFLSKGNKEYNYTKQNYVNERYKNCNITFLFL